MNNGLTDVQVLAEKVVTQERRSRRRTIILYAIPMVAAVVLLYVTFGERLLFSLKTGVPLKHVDLAKEQHELWEANLQCVSEVSVAPVILADGTEIVATVCPSGDVLIGVERQGSRVYRWIRPSGLLPRSGA